MLRDNDMRKRCVCFDLTSFIEEVCCRK